MGAGRSAAGAVAALVLAGVAVVAIVVVSDSPGAGALTAGLLAAVSAAALAAAHQAAARRSAMGALSRQFSVGVGIAVGQLLLAVGLFVVLMFLSAHDGLLVSLVVAFSGVLTVVAARMLAAGVMHDVHTLRDGLMAVGRGERDLRIRTAGSDELAELAAAANAMIDRLGAEEAARRDLVGAVSHDLRTPIASLRLIAEALDDDILTPEERHAYLGRLHVHLGALSGLIEDLFEMSRLQAGEVTWSVRPLALAELVSETVEAMRPEADAKGVSVHAEVPDGLAPVQANPEKVQRVLFNLVTNAIRHTAPTGGVRVSAEAMSGSVELVVADTGEGIGAADRDRVFQPFFQGGTRAARGGGGAGLGLAISRAIVEAHGGRIWLDTEAPGTRVRFSLPLAAAGPRSRSAETAQPR